MNTRDVLARTDLAGLLTELTGQPVGSGPRARWHCCASDHPDHDPSVTMFVDRTGTERWRCWSGGHGGTAIDAVIAAHATTVADAFDYLRHRAGLPATTQTIVRTTPRVSVARPFSDEARRYALDCADRLWTPAGARAREWLHQRGLPDNVLAANVVGYDPGLARQPRADGLPRAGGVTFPSFNPHGEMVYVQTRHLHPDIGRKYTNPTAAHGDIPPATYPITGPDILAARVVIVTEGVPDGLTAVAAGYRAVAVISASLTTRRSAETIARNAHGNTVYLALDNDPAGRAAQRLLHRHLTGRVDVRVVQLADGADLTDHYTTTATRARCQPLPNNSINASAT